MSWALVTAFAMGAIWANMIHIGLSLWSIRKSGHELEALLESDKLAEEWRQILAEEEGELR